MVESFLLTLIGKDKPHVVFGHIMRNDETGVEIRCTPKFVPEWEKRGFKIIYTGLIDLYK